MINILCVTILFIYCWYQFSQWKDWSNPLPATRSQSSSQRPGTGHEYSLYFSTPLRSCILAASYCLTMIFLYEAALSCIHWVAEPNESEALAPLTLIAFILLTNYAPAIGILENGLRFYLQRHSFSPALPSPEEEKLLSQLKRNETCFQPNPKQLANLPSFVVSALLKNPTEHKTVLNYHWGKLYFLHYHLSINKARSLFPATRYTMQREIQFLATQIQTMTPSLKNVDSMSSIQRKNTLLLIDHLLEFTYHLICMKVVSENITCESRTKAFKGFGLIVDIEDTAVDKLRKKVIFFKRGWTSKKKPLNTTQQWRQTDRRQSKRIHCYRKTTIDFQDYTVSANSSVFSINGLAIPGSTDKPLGSKLALNVEGLGDIEGTLVRKKNNEICVAFQENAMLKERAALYLNSI